MLSLNIPPQKLFGWFRRPPLWATGDWQFHQTTCLLMHHHVSCRVFLWNIKSPRWLNPLQPRFNVLQLLVFPQTKITFERKEISDGQRDSGKCDWAADGDWQKCVRSQGVYFEGDWGVIALCTMFLESSSINISIFHITWLDIFWTDLMYIYLTHTGSDTSNIPFYYKIFNYKIKSM